MERFLIESSHTAEDCKRAVKEIHAAGYLHHFEWGCDTGVHTAWAIVEAVDIEHAKQIVPWMFRDKTRVVKVGKFAIADKVHKENDATGSPRAVCARRAECRWITTPSGAR
jgi:hypothetical protein